MAVRVANTDLKKGDTVQLMSGGPVMTVLGDVDGAEIRCGFFFTDGEGVFDEFTVILLPREAIRTVDLQQ